MASTMIEALMERFPLVIFTVIVCLGAVLAQSFFRHIPLSRIPYVASELGSKKAQRMAYLTGAKSIYTDAYHKFKGGVCRIMTLRDAEIVVVSPEFLPELGKLPDHVLSMAAAIDESMETRYTQVVADQPAIVHTIKANLTPSLVRLNPKIAAEVDNVIKREMPSCKSWTNINIHSKLLRIVATVSGMVFVGPELCHEEAYLDTAINYTLDLMSARAAVQRIPPWLRRWKAPYLPQVKKLELRLREADAFLQPIVAARREAESVPGSQKPDDMLQWLMDSQLKFGHTGDQALARSQLGLSFAAIHTTTLTATNAFYNLAAYPEIVKELRNEAKTVLAENNGVFTSVALQNMKKMDSFLKETLRMHPPSYASFERKVLKPITLSTGIVLPSGVTLEAPAYGVTRDAALFANPDVFDGLRFYQQRQRPESTDSAFSASAGKATATAHNQSVSVSRDSLTFGYGRHACPGRFFAVNEIKMILARMVLEYDVRNADGVVGRYPNLEFSNTSIPDPKRDVLFKELEREH